MLLGVDPYLHALVAGGLDWESAATTWMDTTCQRFGVEVEWLSLIVTVVCKGKIEKEERSVNVRLWGENIG